VDPWGDGPSLSWMIFLIAEAASPLSGRKGDSKEPSWDGDTDSYGNFDACSGGSRASCI